jgi:tripartite-type tricarboxylate transporter receptor subunit TctC
MSAAVRADPDGYTLVMASGGDVSLNPALREKMPYNVERDLVPITGVSDAPIVLAADSGTPGIGSITHLVFEWLALSTGTKFQNVPFKGAAQLCRRLFPALCRSA